MRALNMDAPGAVAAATGRGTQETADASTVIDMDGSRKAFLTLQAKLALRGFALYELSCGGYLVARWDRTKHCADLQAVAQFAREVGAPA